MKSKAVILDLFDQKTMARVASQNTRARIDNIKATAAEAIQRAKDAASDKERSDMMAVILGVCRSHKEFTSDDIWEAFTTTGAVKPREPRLLGGLIRSAISLGWCKTTGEVRKSKRPIRHQGFVAVYSSLLGSDRKER